MLVLRAVLSKTLIPPRKWSAVGPSGRFKDIRGVSTAYDLIEIL